MLKRHLQIILANATAGMTLSDAILDTKGNLLLPEDTQLTDAILESLRRHQIETIAVAGAEISETENNIERQQRLLRVEELFRSSDMTSETTVQELRATETLHQYVKNFRAGIPS